MKNSISTTSLILGALFFVLSMGAAAPAQAQACGVCVQTQQAITEARTVILTRISETQQAITDAITQSTNDIREAIKAQTGSLVGANEKTMAGSRELTQGGINYSAALKQSDVVAKAQEMFTAPEAQAFKSCELLSQAQQASSASDSARVESKVMTAVMTKRNTYTENSAKAAKDVVNDYNENYCSQADIDRGRDCKKLATPLMQGAAMRADSLMSPASNKTYTDEESKAAEAFITMVTNPIPVEMLPKGLEKSAGGERFVLEQMHANAQMSVAQHSLARIHANMSKPTKPGGNANTAGIDGSLSFAGLMNKFVDMKFGDPKYAETIQKTGELGMLRELNVQMAFNNWIDFQSYEQSERIEALLATQLAATARERSERQLAVARSQVGRTR